MQLLAMTNKKITMALDSDCIFVLNWPVVWVPLKAFIFHQFMELAQNLDLSLLIKVLRK